MALKQEILKEVEIALENLVNGKAMDEAKAELAQKIKELIPGDQYDALAVILVETAFPVLKSALLAQIEKISDEV